MSQWSDELKAKAIQMYEDAEPTPENSVEIVKEIAAELDRTANGVRLILTKAGVYQKKAEGSKSSTSASSTGDKAPRVSKEAAHKRLTDAIEAAGKNVDSEIISKLTGKAAVYFAELFETDNE